jgi:hypothetical protein
MELESEVIYLKNWTHNWIPGSIYVQKDTASHQWKDIMARYYKNWGLDICENCNHKTLITVL